MNRNNNFQKRFPNYYNYPVLRGFLEESGLSLRKVSVKTGVSQGTVRRVFKGTATQKQVWPIAKFFKVDWMKLHDLSIPGDEFRRAVLNQKVAR